MYVPSKGTHPVEAFGGARHTLTFGQVIILALKEMENLSNRCHALLWDRKS